MAGLRLNSEIIGNYLEQRDFLNDWSDSISFTVQFNITKLVKKLKYGISLALFSSNKINIDLIEQFDKNWLEKLESLFKLLLAELRLKWIQIFSHLWALIPALNLVIYSHYSRY